MPGSQFSTSENLLNQTLQRLDSTLEQQTATAVTGLKLPNFSGSNGEDIYEFLNKFKLATFALSEKHKCLAINKCLLGTANTWAKSKIKKHIIEAQWKSIKTALIERFGPADPNLRKREKLSKLKFESNSNLTLLGYVEKFTSQYRKAYQVHKDADAIIALRLNLPFNVIKSLNLLDDNWSTYTDIEQLLKLIRRYETNILPFEETKEQPSMVLGKDGIKELLNQLRSEFNFQQQQRESQPKELLGVLHAQDKSDPKRLDRYRYHPRPYHQGQRYSNKRRWSEYNPNQGHNSNQSNKYLKLTNKNMSTVKQSDANAQLEAPKSNNNYTRNKLGPPSACYICGGDHWNRDCPKNNNLN